MEKTFKKSTVGLVFFVFSFLYLPLITEAATLFFSPDNGTYKVGSSISVGIYVSSSDKAMNAASGVVNFPTDLLSVTSISKNGSLVDFWAQEPSYSNAAGTINFEGVLLPPGYNSTNGKIVTIIFTIKKAGVANVSLSSGQVLAADGMGTDILSDLGTATYIINGSMPEEVITGVPSAPKISSQTHPDQTKWYAKDDVIFSWTLADDVKQVGILINRLPQTIPTYIYDTPISLKEINDLNDGVRYFHVRLKNSAGWSEISNFKIQIDTGKPTELSIAEIERKDLTDPNPEFKLTALDEMSGIDYYEIRLDGKDTVKWMDNGCGIYKVNSVDPGSHTINVKVFDKAGNYLENSAAFVIEALETPKITDYSKEALEGDSIFVEGTSKYSGSTVNLWVKGEEGEIDKCDSKVDDNGSFSVECSPKLKAGNYSAWVQIIDSRGAKSLNSEIIKLKINSNYFIFILIALLLLLIIAIILISKIFRKKKTPVVFGVKKDDKDVVSRKAYNILRNSIWEQTRVLEEIKSTRPLTVEEEKIYNNLRAGFFEAERNVDNT